MCSCGDVRNHFDMLFVTSTLIYPLRLRGTFLTEIKVGAVVVVAAVVVAVVVVAVVVVVVVFVGVVVAVVVVLFVLWVAWTLSS